MRGHSDDRLTDLEIRMAFLEDTLTTLDELVRQALDGLELVRAEIGGLRDQVDVVAVRGSLVDEVPPHHGTP